ncbi:hypothetical protein GCM10009125_28020 [Castellaniella daejeonensis]|uniref:Gp38 n=1 Tax=Castellaniella daejeonensis TaxID=659013 RepID=A0ABN0U3K2_9BURK
MTQRNDGGPAFPAWELNGHGQPEMTCFGMSLRDYFAAKAMQAAATTRQSDGFTSSERAYWAYRQADAMLAARGRT